MTARPPSPQPRSPSLHIGPIEAEIIAPPELVYQMLGAIGQGLQRPGEWAEILERTGDMMIVDFRTLVSLPLGRTLSVRTREEVRLVGPDSVHYRHLNGPVKGLRETITVDAAEYRGSRLVYRATYPPTGRLASILFRVLYRGVIIRAVRDHFADLRPRAEARAERSRVFPHGPVSDAAVDAD